MKDIISMRDFTRKDIDIILDATVEVKWAIHDPDGFGKKFKKKYGRKVTNCYYCDRSESIRETYNRKGFKYEGGS